MRDITEIASAIYEILSKRVYREILIEPKFDVDFKHFEVKPKRNSPNLPRSRKERRKRNKLIRSGLRV